MAAPPQNLGSSLTSVRIFCWDSCCYGDCDCGGSCYVCARMMVPYGPYSKSPIYFHVWFPKNQIYLRRTICVVHEVPRSHMVVDLETLGS
ncbi:hypothetical protein VNO77_19031 [Canavalia gladiata]|uniref:Uncharacterized protein n=1 Tax=Canavalia gladiata TaxID=3824 RepID=A0AAN9LQT4_CANGL